MAHSSGDRTQARERARGKLAELGALSQKDYASWLAALDRMSGIVNGIDYDEYNPATDTWTPTSTGTSTSRTQPSSRTA